MADATTGNILSVSLPTDLLTGSSGGAGLTLNYNFGPNADAIAQGAYAFVGNSAQTAMAFQSHSVQGTQDFLNGAVAPLLQSVKGESDSYFSQILSAFTSTSAIQQQLATLGINTQGALGSQSIALDKSMKKGGTLFGNLGCFITTAVCERSGRADDCDTLQTMRAWRDGWMQQTHERQAMCEEYYRVAPGYVAAIKSLPAEEQAGVWGELEVQIESAAYHIKCGNNKLALAYYLAAVTFARVAAEHAQEVSA